jgi:hypothetical protein
MMWWVSERPCQLWYNVWVVSRVCQDSQGWATSWRLLEPQFVELRHFRFSFFGGLGLEGGEIWVSWGVCAGWQRLFDRGLRAIDARQRLMPWNSGAVATRGGECHRLVFLKGSTLMLLTCEGSGESLGIDLRGWMLLWSLMPMIVMIGFGLMH